jgi:predicted RNase H-like HicB family nuclease
MELTAIFRKVPGGYVGFVEELPGANTQGRTLAEARRNLSEAVELVLDANRVLAEESLIGQDVIREPLVVSARRSERTSSGISKSMVASSCEKGAVTPST